MPKIREYACECGERFEHMHMSDNDTATCPKCQRTATENDELLGGKSFHVIVPMHRSSLKNKAGYVHTHADRPAEKGSVAVPGNKGGF